ncbi:MAG: GIY-YIG nuclease family protein [Bacteroidota bacterium]|nr:GIY-YIG nuclease family protein [Bacteroidota bacterium]
MAILLKLYLLELENDKYYVGQTDNPGFRFSEHLSGKGAKWTRLHKPLHILLTKELSVDSPGEAMLHENWMTLQQMERFGWKNVRGGDYTIVESYRLQERLEHIYDFEHNKIKYYVTGCHYLFGVCDDWHVYVLELENGRIYIGSCQRLGKSLGEHFGGKGIAWTRDNRVIRVLELITIKPGEGSYIDLKNRLLLDYISRYGWGNVMGGQMPGRG